MLISLLAVIVLGGIAWLGAPHMPYLFGVALPLIAVPVFIVGFVCRIMKWGKSPVPFPIATTGGQQRSLDWIKPSRLDSPYTTTGTVGRMILEVLTFRSLFRNTKSELKDGPRLVYWSSKWLWLFALLFHYCFLIVFIRHFRFFMDPVPFWMTHILETLDGLMQVGTPRFLMSGGLLFVALLFLLGRRLFDAKLRYISLPNDYFPLFLLIGLVGSGLCLRYIGKTDIATVKQFTMSLAHFTPAIPEGGLAPLFYVHLCFLSVLLIYFPFSKLMHMGGVFLSPTRNLPNNSRAVRHINPWNPPKHYHTYAEYEDDFRDLMDEAGLPLEITPEQAAARAAAKE